MMMGMMIMMMMMVMMIMMMMMVMMIMMMMMVMMIMIMMVVVVVTMMMMASHGWIPPRGGEWVQRDAALKLILIYVAEIQN